MGQFPHHEFSNISGLSPVSVFSLELSCVHVLKYLKCILKYLSRLMKNFHFTL